ncbi:MAG: hypothetical protein U5K79_24670 [Cyclobacteriaceae bacterium]|nr:hypothetical protein [Cyclobacteriaceae bacterium]
MNVIIQALNEIPDSAELYYRATAYLLAIGKYKEAYNHLENALILDFDKHISLFEFIPKLETQKALYKIIDQFRQDNK